MLKGTTIVIGACTVSSHMGRRRVVVKAVMSWSDHVYGIMKKHAWSGCGRASLTLGRMKVSARGKMRPRPLCSMLAFSRIKNSIKFSTGIQERHVLISYALDMVNVGDVL
jgi:hypothetical protein